MNSLKAIKKIISEEVYRYSPDSKYHNPFLSAVYEELLHCEVKHKQDVTWVLFLGFVTGCLTVAIIGILGMV